LKKRGEQVAGIVRRRIDIMRNLAEGYIGQEKLSQGASDAWDKIVTAYKMGTIYQARASAVGRKNDSSGGPDLIIWVDRVKGVIPFTHSSLKSPEDARDIVGQIIAFTVRDIDEEKQTFEASRKEALERMAALTWKTVEPGQVRVACVRAVTRYRAIVDVGGVTVPIPAKEVSYYWVEDVRDYLKIEDTLDILVTEVDRDNRKMVVSLRAMEPDPWMDDPDKLPYEGQRVLGTIAAVSTNKDRCSLRINVEPGFVCFSSFRKNGYARHAKGDRVLVRVRQVDAGKRFILGSVVEQRNRSYSPAI
jgi:ribosomal protein S1